MLLEVIYTPNFELITYSLIWVGLGLFLNAKLGLFKQEKISELNEEDWFVIVCVIVSSPITFIITFINIYLFRKWN